jgi:hypothetical protein
LLSNINVNVPADGSALDSSVIRGNFSVAKSEIEGMQTSVSTAVQQTLTISTTAPLTGGEDLAPLDAEIETGCPE